MGKYDGTYVRVQGDKYFVVVREGFLLRRVLVRTGKYKYSDNTLEQSLSWNHRMSKEKQIMETMNEVVARRREKDDEKRLVNNIAERLDEIYDEESW